MHNKKTITNMVLVTLFIAAALSSSVLAAQDFIIENRTSSLFVVNGTTGIMAFSFGLFISLPKEVENAH